MKNIFLKLTVMFCLALFVSCKDNTGPGAIEPIPFSQQYLFEIQYENHAWGYALDGFYIDQSGDCYKYKYEHNGQYRWNPKEPLALTYEELNQKYSGGREFIKTLNKGVLLDKFQLIKGAKAGKLSDEELRMADAGTISFYAFSYDSVKAVYVPVLLLQRGDMYRYNLSNEAHNLYEWLNSVDTSYKAWFSN